MVDVDDRGLSGGLWWSRHEDAGPSKTTVVWQGHDTEDQQAGSYVDAASVAAPTLVTVQTDGLSNVVRLLHVERSPSLWWLAAPETSGRPPALTLVAYDTDERPGGAVVDPPTFASMRTDRSEQVGALRWFPSNGLVHQVYVAPARRRRGIATALFLAGAGYATARGWARLWGSGQRTDLGHALLEQGPSFVRGRAQRRTEVVPPMTPGERARCVPDRLMRPDQG